MSRPVPLALKQTHRETDKPVDQMNQIDTYQAAATRPSSAGRRTYETVQGVAALCSSRAAFQTSRAASAFMAAMPRPTITSGQPETV
jgi:hypothetical protein